MKTIFALLMLLPLCVLAQYGGGGNYGSGGRGGTNALSPTQQIILNRAVQNAASQSNSFNAYPNQFTTNAAGTTLNGGMLTNLNAGNLTGQISSGNMPTTALTLTNTGNIIRGNGTFLTSTNTAPDGTELVNKNYVLGLIGASSLNLYFSATTNSPALTTNIAPMYTMVDGNPPSNAQTNTIVNANITAGTYFLNRIETNTVNIITAPTCLLYTYVSIAGGGTPTVTARPEIWLYNTNGAFNLLGTGATVVYNDVLYATPQEVNVTILLTNTAFLQTNLPSGSKLMLRWFVSAKNGSPTWSFYIGNGYASRITLGASINPIGGYAYLAGNQEFTGTNTFAYLNGNAGGLTNLSRVLPNTAATATADFAAKELTVTGNLTFVRATNTPPVGNTVYLGATVSGIATIDYPAVWSPNNTNHPVTLTNGLVALKAFGTNVTISTYQP